MKDRKNESLSALCDGECDELEVRRILNQFSSDPELREQWRRYHLLGSIMREEAASSVDLSEGIMQALDGEPMDDVPALTQSSAETVPVQGAAVNKRRMPQWLTSSAVAASVTLAVLVGARFVYEPFAIERSIGGQTLVQNEVQSELMAPVVATVSNESEVAAIVNPVNVASISSVMTSDVSAEELRKAQDVLNQYVLEHENEVINANKQALPSFVRVANFGADNKAAVRKD